MIITPLLLLHSQLEEASKKADEAAAKVEEAAKKANEQQAKLDELAKKVEQQVRTARIDDVRGKLSVVWCSRRHPATMGG